MSIRSSSYNHEEDKLLCRVYMRISQDSIVGVYQSSDWFWSRVEEAFNQEKLEHWEVHSKRSMQARIQTIEKAAKKLHACIKAVEDMHQSGASNEDIMHRAKILFTQDPQFKSGWKYDHVWDIIKNFEKFKDGATRNKKKKSSHYTSSESENPTPESVRQASPGISSFSLNLGDSDDVVGESPLERPIGVKKAKLKRKMNDDSSSIINTMHETNNKLLDELKKTNEQLKYQLEMQNKSNALKEMREENRILFQDVSSIKDHSVRAYVEAEKARILQKRAEQVQLNQYQTDTFGRYFNNLGGSGADLPDY